MNNAEIIARLQKMGPLPDDSSSAIDTYPLQESDAVPEPQQKGVIFITIVDRD
jgi:hypothetical protein